MTQRKPQNKDKALWWEAGIQFECQGSGQCCVSHGEYGNVWLTLEDRQKLARFLGLSTQTFTRKHCEKIHGIFRLVEEKPECRFLSKKRCSVYSARPTQCRTWPFWPEVMDPKTWKKEVAQFCPGIGKGKLWKKEKIEQLLFEQRESEKRLVPVSG